MKWRGYQGTASVGLDTDNSGDAHRHATELSGRHLDYELPG
ncbi:MAG: hypothetical protein ABSD32_14935 [Mycobacterium sp.]